MIFDLLFLLFAVGALVTGYRNGFLKTLLRGALFIAGGIAAMYFVVERNQSGWLIVAILVGAYAGAFVGTLVAKSLRLTIVRGPLRLADSLLGAALEVGKYVLLFFIVGTILTYAPWGAGKEQIAASKVYAEMNERAPGVLTEIRKQVEEVIKTNLR
jgi:O-antigen/teichoic acid export membrane protein